MLALEFVAYMMGIGIKGLVLVRSVVFFFWEELSATKVMKEQ
jgi:hypothetical protein